MEPGELLAEAVVRELREEAGVEGICGELVGWVERPGDDHHFVILDFAVQVLDPEPLTAGDDAAEAEWVHLRDVPDLDLVDGLAAFLHRHGFLPTIATEEG